MKNIVLIEPRSPDYHIFSRYKLPRLGNLILGALLEQAGYYVKVYVEDIAPIDIKTVFEADLVGISTITSTAPRAYELSSQIRKRGIPVMMGGAHVTFMAEEALQYCDYVLRGEAEGAIVPLVKALETGEGLGDVSGLSFRVGNQTFHNPEVPPCHNMDEIPFPDFSLIRSPKGSIRPIMTSRGCPYNCSFCMVTKMFGRRYRFRSKEHVMRELRTVDPKDVIFFYDDHFAANKERTKELLRMMIDEDITPRWTAQVRADVTKDREMMELFRKSNCFYVYVGIESVNPQSLESYNKKISVKEIEDSIAVFHEYGIRVHGMFVMGCDEDTVESIRYTPQFAKKNKIDTVQFMILTPLPGSDQYKALKEENRLLTEDWGLYDGHHVVFQPKNMSAFELQVEAFKAQGNFYSMGQILKAISKFDLLGVLLKSYSRRLQKKWVHANKYYYDIVKQMTTGAADRVNLTWNRTRDEIARLTQGIKDKGSQSSKTAENKGYSE